MAKTKKDDAEQPDQKEFVSDSAKLDWGVEVESLDDDKYHKTGQKFTMGAEQAKKAEEQGRVKIIGPSDEYKGKLNKINKEGAAAALKGAATMVLLVLAILFSAPKVQAQSSVLKDLRSIYGLTLDTVTNSGTVYLESSRVGGPGSVTITANVTKISGTVGGTITLQGSLDGTTYYALNTPNSQTALATITAADASANYHWRLESSPFIYYRVSWTGTGTMAASFTAKILKH